MAQKTYSPGAVAAAEATIRELELEERLTRRRMDSAAVGLNVAKEEGGDLESAQYLADFQRVRWELWESALRAAKRKLATLEAREEGNDGSAA